MAKPNGLPVPKVPKMNIKTVSSPKSTGGGLAGEKATLLGAKGLKIQKPQEAFPKKK